MEMLIHSRKVILMGMIYGLPDFWEPGRWESDHQPICGLDRSVNAVADGRANTTLSVGWTDQRMLWQMGSSPPYLWAGQTSRPAVAVTDGELTTLAVDWTDQRMLWQTGSSPPYLWAGQTSRPEDAVANGELTTLSVC
jgi:hypothetical protein